MSLRAIGTRLFRHGQTLVRGICRRHLNTINIVEPSAALPGPASQAATPTARVIPRNFALRSVGLQVGLHARRILIDNVLNRVTNSLASELRKKAAKRILFGDSAPFFALVGVSLASGTGIITKEEELEGVCWEIREAVSKIKWHYHDIDIDEKRFEDDPITLKDLDLDEPIAKGANAVVYTARIKNETNPNENNDQDGSSLSKYPFALKMMFNYDVQSSAMAILKAMYRETVPARVYYSNVGVSDWEIDLSTNKRHLPPHPNVVAMFSVFTDYIPELQQAKGLYPAALPKRIYPDGEGRNMSLFLLMKRYNCSVQQFMMLNDVSIRTSIILLAQLLEGVAHLAAHGVAHRDLKADNLLLDTTEPDAPPVLVISDFGCCLADRTHGLHLPYTCQDVDKGGNAALMAPEIVTQTPGTFSVLNYTKSDVWAAGAIAYEIFGSINPFYGGPGVRKLKSWDYKDEDLPDLPENVPQVVKSLIKNLLSRSVHKRLDPEIASNVCQLYLWAPSAWIKPGRTKLPSSAEILEWLLCMTTKVLCEGRCNSSPNKTTSQETNAIYKVGRRTYPEYLLISSFLCRAKLSNIKSALSWIQNNV